MTLTRRDHFAAAALSGFTADTTYADAKTVAKDCREYADALIAELDATEKKEPEKKVDGWTARYDDYENGHRHVTKDKKHYREVTFHRFVETPSTLTEGTKDL